MIKENVKHGLCHGICLFIILTGVASCGGQSGEDGEKVGSKVSCNDEDVKHRVVELAKPNRLAYLKVSKSNIAASMIFGSFAESLFDADPVLGGEEKLYKRLRQTDFSALKTKIENIILTKIEPSTGHLECQADVGLCWPDVCLYWTEKYTVRKTLDSAEYRVSVEGKDAHPVKRANG